MGKPTPATARNSSWFTTTPTAVSGAPTALLLPPTTASQPPVSRTPSVPSPTKSSKALASRPAHPTLCRSALATASNQMDFTIEFADKPGQTGVQYLMEVDINKRGAGSFPVSGGITGASSDGVYSVAEMNFNTNL